jgi:heme/copper-type cytochrome/quinol oxidase subunit 2
LRSLFLPAAAVALISQLAVLWAVVAGRAPASSRRPTARWAEIAWVAIPTVVLLAVLYATWGAMNTVALIRSITGVPA